MILSGKNFQSWEEFNIELNGLTVLVGPSNKGKSAIFRALRAICRNQIAETFIRNKQEAPLEITLELGDQTISAKRAKKGSLASPTYWIDGQEFAKLAGQIPEQVQKLGFNEIKVGEYTLDPIFAEQSEPQFLLDRRAYGPTMLNAILGAFASTDRLELGKKEANLRVTQKNSEAKTYAVEIRDHEERKLRLGELSDQGGEVAARLHRLEAEIRRKEARLVWTSECTKRKTRHASLLQILNRIRVPEPLATLAVRENTTIGLLRQVSRSTELLTRHGAKVKELEQLTLNWSIVVTNWKRLKAFNDLIELKVKPSPANTAKQLNAVIGKVENTLTAAIVAHNSIKFIGQVSMLRDRISITKIALKQAEVSLKDAQQVSGLCPDCGEPLEHKCQKKNQ